MLGAIHVICGVLYHVALCLSDIRFHAPTAMTRISANVETKGYRYESTDMSGGCRKTQVDQ